MESNQKFCQMTLELRDKIEECFLMLGERLYKIREKELYLGTWDTWGDFLEEMKISDSVASKMITVYEKFVLTLGVNKEKLLEAGGWTVLYDISKVVNTEKEADEWLNKAKTLSRKDLAIEMTEQKKGIPQKDCDHDDTYVMRVCKTCGFKEKVHDND